MNKPVQFCPCVYSFCHVFSYSFVHLCTVLSMCVQLCPFVYGFVFLCTVLSICVQLLSMCVQTAWSISVQLLPMCVQLSPMSVQLCPTAYSFAHMCTALPISVLHYSFYPCVYRFVQACIALSMCVQLCSCAYGFNPHVCTGLAM